MTRPSAGSVRGVPVAPRNVPRLPVATSRGGVGVREVFLQQIRPHRLDPWDAPILEWRDGPGLGTRDPRDRGYGDDRRFGDDRRYGDDRRLGDDGRFGDDRRFGHDKRYGHDRRFGDDRRFGHDRRFDGRRTTPCSGLGGLRVAVGSDGVRVGVGSSSRQSKYGYGSHASRCRRDRRGGIIVLPYGTGGTIITGGTVVGGGSVGYGGASDASADPHPPSGAQSTGYHATNATGTAFSGSDGRYGGATGCAEVTVRLRKGEWYGAEVRLPALGAETPEALAAALRARHRHGRSSVLRGFDGASLGVPAGPGVEAVEVVPCR